MRDNTVLNLHHTGIEPRRLTVRDIRDNALDCAREGRFKRARLLRQIATAQSMSAATS